MCAVGPKRSALREGRNIGKVVLTIPQPLDPEATVLITGGTGDLGGLLARHWPVSTVLGTCSW